MVEVPDFRRVASYGFGDPLNSRAWSMAWFKGRLYVGTGRDVAWLYGRRGSFAYLDPSPISLPPRSEVDLRAQIWRYTPETGVWDRVYTSPLVTTSQLRTMLAIPLRRLLKARRSLSQRSGHRRAGLVVQGALRVWRQWVRSGFRSEEAREVGYRNMAVYTDKHGTEALYVVNIGAAGCLLRTADGATFETIATSGPSRRMAFGFRPLVSFKGRLYTSTIGHPLFPNVSTYPAVLETDDPARGATDRTAWRAVSAPGFGDACNLSIFEMAVFQDHLYVGTANLNGFQIWKTDATGSPPYSWRQVVTNGGHKGPSDDLAAISMCPFGEWLYVGSGRMLADRDALEPTPGDLIRLAPDDSWEVVAGEPRDTLQGFKTPISGMPAGFGNPLAMYVWRMAEHRGWLYAGIHDATTLLLYTPQHRLGPSVARWVDQYKGAAKVVEGEGGCDLWRTQDGIHWTCMTRTGFDNPFNLGVRTLTSTPVGLFVGTYNFFTEAKDPVTGEHRGGTEIWLGAS